MTPLVKAEDGNVPTVRLEPSVGPKLLKLLQLNSEATGLSISQQVTEAIEDYLAPLVEFGVFDEVD